MPHPEISEVDASRAELLRYLAEISGRSIRTRADVEKYLGEVAAGKRQAASARRWHIAKTTVLVVLAFAAALQYYLMDVLLQIASLRHLTFFVG